jgi:magnesium transporter
MTTQPANSWHPADEERLSAIHRGLASGSLQHGRRMLNALQPAEIAHLLESLPRGQREILWRLVDPSHEGEVLLHVTEDVREPLLRAMDPAALLAATAGLATDMVGFLAFLGLAAKFLV